MGKKNGYVKKAIKVAKDLMNPPKVRTTGRDKTIHEASKVSQAPKKSGKDEGWKW